jgi:small subunit ribosomal protein S16
MVRIRLRRVGGKKQPSYRIVAADKESPRDGRFLEILGFYNPRTEPLTLQMKEERIYDWMSKGAQPSDSVKQLFRSAGLLERFARFKEGESIEVLLEEAEAAAQSRLGSPKTTGETPTKKSKPKETVAAEVKPEAKAESKAKAEIEVEAKPEPEAEVEVEAEAEPEVEIEPESEAEIEAEVAPEAEAEVEAEPEAEAEVEVDAEVESEAEVEPEGEAEAEPEVEGEAEVEVEADVEPEAETKK